MSCDMSCDMSCEEGTGFRPDGAGGVAMALRALESPDWPQLTRAVLGRNGTRREVVQRLADLILGTGRRVYGADGVEIAVGDTVWVWAKRDGRKWTVVGFDFSKRHSVIAVDDSDIKRELKPEWLTHTEPDSWERLESDAALSPADYIDKRGRRTDLYAYQEMPIDLVRRAKALAGVEADE